MSTVNGVVHLHSDIQSWRQHLHSCPELGYNEHHTSAFVAERLREFGCDDVVTGLGMTGVVGLIKGKEKGR